MTTALLVPASDPEVRRTGLGSSDMSAVVGLNRFRTALDVWMEKTGRVEPQEAGEAAEWGTILEPVILRQLARRENVSIIGRDERGTLCLFMPDYEVIGWDEPTHAFLMGTLRHPDHPWMIAHLDGLVIEDGNVVAHVEAKTAGYWMGKHFGEEGSDEIAPEYLVQVQHAGEILRAHLGRPVPTIVPALIAGQSWRVFRVSHQPDIAAMLISEGEAFWRRVVQDSPPPADPDERGLSALARLYPQHDEEELVVSPGSSEDVLLEELFAARVDLADAEARCAAAEVAVKERMATAAALISARGKVTWRTQTRKNTDHKAVYAELGVPAEIIERHTTEKPSRVFRVTPSKEAR